MIFHWIDDDNYKAISAYLVDEKIKISLHFEDALAESCWTYIDKNTGEEVWAGAMPMEFIDALRKHLEDRK